MFEQLFFHLNMSHTKRTVAVTAPHQAAKSDADIAGTKLSFGFLTPPVRWTGLFGKLLQSGFDHFMKKLDPSSDLFPIPGLLILVQIPCLDQVCECLNIPIQEHGIVQ
jgi:hypothetical protein